jgi:hypothetical protein
MGYHSAEHGLRGNESSLSPAVTEGYGNEQSAYTKATI